MNYNLSSIPGVRLPTTTGTWEEANEFFIAHPPLPESLVDLDDCAEIFQKNIYNYFSKNCGLNRAIKERTAKGGPKRREMNIANKSIRKRMRELKELGDDVPQIRALSAMLRKNLNTVSQPKTDRR